MVTWEDVLQSLVEQADEADDDLEIWLGAESAWMNSRLLVKHKEVTESSLLTLYKLRTRGNRLNEQESKVWKYIFELVMGPADENSHLVSTSDQVNEKVSQIEKNVRNLCT